MNLQGSIVGLRHDVFGLSFFTYLIPRSSELPGVPSAPALAGYDGLRGYMGVVQILLAVVAVGGLTRGPENRSPQRAAPQLFFFASALAIILKRYGAPVINSLGICRFASLYYSRSTRSRFWPSPLPCSAHAACIRS